MVLFCSVCFFSKHQTAHSAVEQQFTPRERQLYKILESSGKSSQAPLLSEQYRLNNSLKRDYIQTFMTPDWTTDLRFSAHVESQQLRDPALAASFSLDSQIQLGNNFDAHAEWSVFYQPKNMTAMRKVPSFTPLLDSLTLSYGKMRTVEFTAGVPRDFGILINRPALSVFSGIAAKIHPLIDKVESSRSKFEFEIEHGWSFLSDAHPKNLRLTQVQRTRPKINFSRKSRLATFKGSAALEWFTDPDGSINLLSSMHPHASRNSPQDPPISWRLFVLQSSIEIFPTQRIFSEISASRVNNSLVNDALAGWSTSFAIGGRESYQQALASFKLSTTIFKIPTNSLPSFRLPFDLSSGSTGSITDLGLSFHPSKIKSQAFTLQISYFRESPSSSASRANICQNSEINRKNLCNRLSASLTLTRRMGPNL